MKFIIILLMTLFFIDLSLADTECNVIKQASEVTGQLVINTDVPKHLQGAIITVRLKNGSESVVPSEKFKVVPRVQQYVTTEVTKSSLKECTTSNEHKNRISLLAGHGRKDGLDVSTNGNVVEVENKVGLVGGLQYQRNIVGRLSVGGVVQTNKTVSGVLGLDF